MPIAQLIAIILDQPEDGGRQCVASTDMDLYLKTKQFLDISNVPLTRVVLEKVYTGTLEALPMVK